MNIMTIFVYGAGRQGKKVRLLLMNLKDTSVFRVEENYAYWWLKTISFLCCEKSQLEMIW